MRLVDDDLVGVTLREEEVEVEGVLVRVGEIVSVPVAVFELVGVGEEEEERVGVPLSDTEPLSDPELLGDAPLVRD